MPRTRPRTGQLALCLDLRSCTRSRSTRVWSFALRSRAAPTRVRIASLVDHLTIHETARAYCPPNVRIEGHDWKPTGGVTVGEIEIVIGGMRERAGVNGHFENKDP